MVHWMKRRIEGRAMKSKRGDNEQQIDIEKTGETQW